MAVNCGGIVGILDSLHLGLYRLVLQVEGSAYSLDRNVAEACDNLLKHGLNRIECLQEKLA